MNSEHLLEAMGLLDDDLIAQAEEPVRTGRPVPSRKWWTALAACLALVAALSIYGPMWGGTLENTGSTSAGGVVWDGPAEDADSAGGEEASPSSPSSSSGAAGDSSVNNSDEVLIVIVRRGDRIWSYQHWYEEDRVLDTLPEGCRSLGEVGTYREGEDCVYTDMGEFPGCPLWIAGEDMEGPVYLELPQGGYLECRRA